jgi:hypothetical protein
VSLFSRAFAWIFLILYHPALHVPGAECKKTDKNLSSIGALVYSWYTATYVGFIALHFAHSIIASLRIILRLVHLASAGGNPSRHVPKPRTIISMKCLDTSVLIPIRITRLLRLPRQNAPPANYILQKRQRPRPQNRKAIIEAWYIRV